MLVKPDKMEPVLPSGDVVPFAGQIAPRGVPGFNASRADSLALMDRMIGIVQNVKAMLIIRHDPRDNSKLPTFPAAAQKGGNWSEREEHNPDSGKRLFYFKLLTSLC